jgi:hypothetical protein
MVVVGLGLMSLLYLFLSECFFLAGGEETAEFSGSATQVSLELTRVDI